MHTQMQPSQDTPHLKLVDSFKAVACRWVGPPANAIRALGNKATAKRVMTDAGVACVPGYHGAAQDIHTLAAEAARIGYVCLLLP